ncbi:MAG: group I intron-associated PD-(D/E)XK endonuclease [Terriglobales bacterium]
MQTYKAQGELVELRFLTRAAELGLRVSKPWGDSAPYDFLVESGGEVFKVQVKSTRFRHLGSQSHVCVAAHHNKPYKKKEVNFIAAYIVDEDVWYIIPLHVISGRHIYLNPRRQRNPFRRYREAWDLLIPERRNRRVWRKPKPASKPIGR